MKITRITVVSMNTDKARYLSKITLRGQQKPNPIVKVTFSLPRVVVV